MNLPIRAADEMVTLARASSFLAPTLPENLLNLIAISNPPPRKKPGYEPTDKQYYNGSKDYIRGESHWTNQVLGGRQRILAIAQQALCYTQLPQWTD